MIAGNNKTFREERLHAGDLFYVNNFVELNENGELYMQIKTPSDRNIHLQWIISSSKAMETYLYESPTEQADGSIVTPLNANRQSSRGSSMVLRSGVSAPASTGTTVDSVKEGIDSRRIKTGADISGQGLLLKKDTVYIRKFKSNDASNVIAFEARWVETI